MTTIHDLSDLKTQFYALMENYPTVYANYKVTPKLPSVMQDHDKIESGLTSLHRRMFAFQAGVEKELDQHETTVTGLTSKNAKLNAMLARKNSSLESKDALMRTNATVHEPFTTINGLSQLSGCILDSAGNPTNCPCVEAGSSSCSGKCKESCPVTTNQISLVAEAKSIEKSAYMYSIGRIVYLLTGITIISYFIFQTVGSPNSIILADVKIKAEQLKNNLTEKAESFDNKPLQQLQQ